MTQKASPPVAAPAPGATQAVTVVQPAERPLSLDVGDVAAWAAAIAAIVMLIGLVHRLLTRDVNRDIANVRDKLSTATTRIDAIEHNRTDDIARIVKLETAQAAFDKAVERVERGQEKLAETIGHRLDKLVDSFRDARPQG